MSYEVTVTESVNKLTVQREVPTLTVAAVGPQGPAGPQGPTGAAGGSAFEHVQTIPMSSWVLNHGFGRRVHVSVFDDTGALVLADVIHGTSNQATIVFAVPTTGSAVIS